jgi:hypothetical protein
LPERQQWRQECCFLQSSSWHSPRQCEGTWSRINKWRNYSEHSSSSQTKKILSSLTEGYSTIIGDRSTYLIMRNWSILLTGATDRRAYLGFLSSRRVYRHKWGIYFRGSNAKSKDKIASRDASHCTGGGGSDNKMI